MWPNWSGHWLGPISVLSEQMGYPSMFLAPPALSCVSFACPTDLVEFTDEEGYGRYLDLHDCYLKYINLKSSEVRG